jgi:dTDP-4-amino-4,6-dideoxygalactose transaminase
MAATLKEKGVQIMFPYAPAHWTAAFSGAVRQDLPNTERFARCTLAVPTLGVSDSDVDEICGLLLDASAARAASPEPAPVYRS